MISRKLIDKTNECYKKALAHADTKKVIINPSLPILYFGDLITYEKSKIKIVTVGKNPSDREFRLGKNDPFSFVRFPLWNVKKQNLTETLNDYFKEKPLNWFSCYEPVLNRMSASYYPGNNHANTALHTDLCSPLATCPTWSKLTIKQQDSLFNEGYSIWKELIEELQPDIMLVSFAKSSGLFRHICTDEGEVVTSFDKKKDGNLRKVTFIVTKHKYLLKNKKEVKVIFGYQEANKPFDRLSNGQREKIGEELCRQ